VKANIRSYYKVLLALMSNIKQLDWSQASFVIEFKYTLHKFVTTKIAKYITNFFKDNYKFLFQKCIFLQWFPPQFTQITILLFNCKHYLKKHDLHWMFIPWLALQGLAFWLPWFWHVQDRSWRDLAPAWVKAMTDSN